MPQVFSTVNLTQRGEGTKENIHHLRTLAPLREALAPGNKECYANDD